MPKKIGTRFIVLFLISTTAVLVVVQLSATRWVEHFLERKIPSHIVIDYQEVSANIFTGSIRFEAPQVRMKNRENGKLYAQINTSEVAIEALNYLPLFFEETIDLASLSINSPQVTYFPFLKRESLETDSMGVVSLLKTIQIDQINITDGTVSVFQNAQDSLLLKVRSVNLSLNHAKTDPVLITKKLPFSYESYSLLSEGLTLAVGPYEALSTGKMNIKEERLTIDELQFGTQGTREDFSSLLEYEQDHVVLQIPNTTLVGLEFGFESNRFFVTADSLLFLRPHLQLYRDKRLADDFTEKDMYSTMLRQTGFHFNFPKIQFTKGEVSYEERIRSGGAAGRIFFDRINGSVHNLNTQSEEGDNTILDINGLLMGEAPTELSYMFDKNDTLDNFLAKGHIASLSAEDTNPFLRPNLGIKAAGFIDHLYFTVSGNRYSSQGDMKMKYQNFTFDILKKDRSGVNKILSAIANVFVNDGSNANANGYRFGQINTKREANKSFFNYLWNNVRDGVVSTMTGDGEKEN